jgi:hypothetical protein
MFHGTNDSAFLNQSCPTFPSMHRYLIDQSEHFSASHQIHIPASRQKMGKE